MERLLFDVSEGFMFFSIAIFTLGLLGLFVSAFIAIISRLIWPARVRLRHVAKVTAGASTLFLAVGLLLVLFGVFNAAPLLIALAMIPAFAWLFFRMIPDEVGPEARVYGGWEKLRERFIDVTTMERPLLLLTALAVAQLIASAVLLVAYSLPAAPRSLQQVGMYEGQPVSMEGFVFWTTVAFLIAAWSLVLVGASPGGTTRVLILIVFTIATFPSRLSQHVFAFIWLGMIALVWSWALMTWRRRGHTSDLTSSRRWRPTIVSLLFVAGALGAYYLILVVLLPDGPDSFPRIITDQIFNFALVLVPILFLTGRDCAELAELGAHFALALVPRRHSRRVVAIVTLFVGGSVLYWSATTLRIPSFSDRSLANYFSPWGGLLLLGAPLLAILLVLILIVYRFARRQPVGTRVILFSIAILLALIAAVIGSMLIFAFSAYSLAIGVLGIASVLAVRLVMRTSTFREWRSAHVPFIAVFLTALILTGAHELVTLWQAGYGVLPPHAADEQFEPTECATQDFRLGSNAYAECSFAYPTGWRRLFSDEYRTLAFQDEAFTPMTGETPNTRPTFLLTVRDESEAREISSDVAPVALARAIWPFLPVSDISRVWNVELGFGKRPAWAGAEFMTYRDGVRQHVWIWARRIDRLVWVLGAVAPERYRIYYEDIFRRIVASWRPGQTTPEATRVVYPELRSTALRISSFGLLPVLLAPLGFVILFLPRVSSSAMQHRKWARALCMTSPAPRPDATSGPGTPRDIAGFFIITVAIAAFFFLPHGELTEALGRTRVISENARGHAATAGWAPAAQAVTGFHLFVAGATVIFAVICLVRGMPPANAHLLVELLQLNVALVFLSTFVWIYSGVSWVSEHNVWAQATLLIILKLWDLLVSGKDVTNINGRVFQRRFLVLLYLGYLMLVSTAILYFSSQRLPDYRQPMEHFFDAEILVRQGIVWLGIPLLLVGFLFRIRRMASQAFGYSSPPALQGKKVDT